MERGSAACKSQAELRGIQWIMTEPSPKVILTVGHSNRPLEDFITLLREHETEAVVDVRRFPTSKFEHFCKPNLEESLAKAGIRYYHVAELGGFRHGYREYTETSEFGRGLNQLLKIASRFKTAVMCAEKLFFRCHRRFIADRLVERGMTVLHVMNGRLYEHKRPDHERRRDTRL